MNSSLERTPESKTKESILFVCVVNAGHSQMAEDFFRKYALISDSINLIR